MSIVTVIERGLKNGMVQDWDKMTADDRENLNGVERGQCISVPCRLVCDHIVTGEKVEYRLIYKIDAYSAKKRKAWGYAENLDEPQFSEFGPVYIDNTAYTWQTA